MTCKLFLGMSAAIVFLFFTSLAAQEAAAEAPADSGAAVQVVVIQPVGDKMEYATTEFTVKAGTRVKVVMDNIAKMEAMQHNVVILKPGADKQAVGMAGIMAGEAKGYLPDHEAVLFYTGLAKPGEKTEVEFTAPPPGDYPYLCSYPGHFAFMFGVMHSVE